MDDAPIRLVIFDFDGTLSDSGEWFLSVLDTLSARFSFRTVDRQEIEMLRSRSTREVINYLGIPRWKMPMIARHVRKLVAYDTDRIHLFPGTAGLIEGLAATGVRIALVTSNSEANARAILGASLAARIDFYACGSSLFGKAPKFRKVLRRMAIPAADALSIGDETRDIDAAREVGMRAGSVLWGYASEAVLMAQRPDVAFRTHAEILDYVAARR